MKIIDNYLTHIEYEDLHKYIMSLKFPWYFCNEKVIGSDIDYNYQFIHNVVQNGKIENKDTFQILKPLFKKLNPLNILRVKLNLTTKTHKIIKFPLHRDINVRDEKDTEQLKKDNFKIAIYYINTNNGYTYFENEKKVKSEANRLVKFDNIMYHSGTTHTDQNKRVLININYNEKR